MNFTLFDYVDTQGNNVFKVWTQSLQKVQLAKLNELLDKLEMHGDGLFPHMLTNSGVAGILKLRARGNVQLRPLLCRGPIDVEHEYTLLMGAKEIGGKWSPKGAPKTAEQHKDAVMANPDKRRKTHERVS